jgi:hypothetical protein
MIHHLGSTAMNSPHPVSGEITLDSTHEAAGELLLIGPLL